MFKAGNVADHAAREEHHEWKFVLPYSDGYAFTSPVGKFLPNPFGLYDMHGNAYQWCSNRYSEERMVKRTRRDRTPRELVKGYYDESPMDDPQGPATGDARSLRSGAGTPGRATPARPTGSDAFPANALRTRASAWPWVRRISRETQIAGKADCFSRVPGPQ